MSLYIYRKRSKWQVRLGVKFGKKTLGVRKTVEEAEKLRDEYLFGLGYRIWRGVLLKVEEEDKEEPYIHKQEDGNTLIVETKVEGIHTLEQALEYAQIDLDIWEVDHWIWNKWPVGAKVEKKNLQFDEGKITGTIESVGLTIAPLIQVKIWLKRKLPLPIFAHIQPVHCSPVIKPTRPAEDQTIKTSLIYGDSQIGFRRDLRNGHLDPFHDRMCLDLVCQLADTLQPDLIVNLGDYLDMTTWTDKFVRTPDFLGTTQPAVLEAYWWLARLRNLCPNTTIVMLEGNHEKRIPNYISTHLHAAYGLKPAEELTLSASLSISRLLCLHNLAVEWVEGYPDAEYWISPRVIITHGDRGLGPGATSKKIAYESDVTVVYGHIHRQESVSRNFLSKMGYRTISAFCPGCTCKTDGSVPGHRMKQQWQQGIAWVEYTSDAHTITPILIENGKLIFGCKFTGEDQVEGLREMWPDWNW